MDKLIKLFTKHLSRIKVVKHSLHEATKLFKLAAHSIKFSYIQVLNPWNDLRKVVTHIQQI